MWLNASFPTIPYPSFAGAFAAARIGWTYHVNMRLGRRFIARETIISAVDS
jgi:hypothetical protein